MGATYFGTGANPENTLPPRGFCVRCGRANPEAQAFTGPACHPAWSTGRSCYTEENYEWTFRQGRATGSGILARLRELIP